jgi:hypothetical protein
MKDKNEKLLILTQRKAQTGGGNLKKGSKEYEYW